MLKKKGERESQIRVNSCVKLKKGWGMREGCVTSKKKTRGVGDSRSFSDQLKSRRRGFGCI